MSNKLKAASLGAFVAFGVWFYFTPHLAVSRMQSAVEAGEFEKLSGYVDFPSLKDNLTTDLRAKLSSGLAGEYSEHPLATALGSTMAAAFINPTIEALVAPANLAMAMKGVAPQPTDQRSKSSKSKPAVIHSEVETTMAYENFDRFIVTVKKREFTEKPLGLVFTGKGLFSWQLTALKLPM